MRDALSEVLTMLKLRKAFLGFLNIVSMYNSDQKRCLKAAIFGLKSWTLCDEVGVHCQVESYGLGWSNLRQVCIFPATAKPMCRAYIHLSNSYIYSTSHACFLLIYLTQHPVLKTSSVFVAENYALLFHTKWASMDLRHLQGSSGKWVKARRAKIS